MYLRIEMVEKLYYGEVKLKLEIQNYKHALLHNSFLIPKKED